ncbi:hydantoinase/oxoprolinase family protein [Sinosporangium siamense]|uniref:Hydantoinase subunit beta n=1 Tax=Sinosporangium siamense TaxID=1367973 RepID=A0A919RKL8_9ACTN|nr:hydantoinase/oxoprolinase family protein [Sinosporangium siamense]GII95333.1 hydantoinase subunit beta [Sinosporangium siamense]
MSRGPGVRVGVDVGGTNTDAVVLAADLTLLAKAKVPTTENVLDGVRDALAAAMGAAEVGPADVHHVMVSTTHATNALIRRRGLRRVAVLRIGAPATLGISVLSAWPQDVRDAVVAASEIVRGGAEVSGVPIVPLDVAAIERFARSAAGEADAFSVTGVFSPVTSEDEVIAREIIRSVAGDVPVSMSHEVGTIGLADRESASALNAALTAVTQEVVDGVAEALRTLKIAARLYVAQNDGTLMAADWAVRCPVLTIGSGPASSMRGAAYLSSLADAVVVDIGGTSTDIGVLTGGMPRSSASAIEIGGVRANFRMPDLLSLGLGGGSVVRMGPGGVVAGPDSVGGALTRSALVFGGDVPTLSDMAVARGRLTLGDPALAAAVDERLHAVLDTVDARLAESIERIQRSSVNCPVVVVGGAGGLMTEVPPGCSELIRPAHHDVANAVGAAVAMISREVDEVVPAGMDGREERLERLYQRARERTIAAGADPAGVEIAAVHETPLAYLLDPAVRIRVKAVGPLPGKAIS